MKLSVLATIITLATAQWYPLGRDGEIPLAISPYTVGEEVLIDCIARNIDNGEHKFDDQERIIYSSFPICKETGKPLSFKYGISEDKNCTIGFTDQLYHLFQLYIHEDVPFSCRLPLSKEPNSIEKGGAFIPLTFNFRGEIHDSHLDVDSSLNVLFSKPTSKRPEENTFISAVAFSSGTNATRIVIGDSLTLNLAVRWYDNLANTNSLSKNYQGLLPYADGFYKLPINFVPISYSSFYIIILLVALTAGSLSWILSNFYPKKLKGYKPVDAETGFSKLD
ncbi:uncharacterized protein CANTADRAFT_46470 [Suhomyces tanzawaensis NRRL Y-17324]|uniref:Protein BIG1 n=1 Tax=Suhomyces tanzawaensis NRRL Y-17324 TaxID=984487 RepID=A0A1E4SNB0_9ASCO|nr:uncharacterized protein CANTADRAFT_46470 [Suhomyces tanzawaensis NRRL Y-17324]ODV80985.1 hypothetical protein CANTADRAFT_46470 [Suhomyces tanzawaensis NRRL Y-17324]